MGTIANVQADVVQLLSGRTTVAVARGQKGKPLRAIAGIVLSQSTVSRAHVGCDAPIRQPLQELPVPVGRISRHRIGGSSLPPSLVLPRSRNCGCRSDSCRSIPVAPVYRPWSHRWNRDPWSTLGLA